MTNKIRNTSDDFPTGVPISFLGLSSADIEASEAQGQKELINSSVLPIRFLGGEEEKDSLKAMGVVFGEPVKGDPLFQYVSLPQAWKIKPTDHSMWSKLIDESGNIVGRIFYKAAFYDRRAHFILEKSK